MTCKTKNQTLLANKQNVNPRKINHQGMMGFVAPYTVYKINHKDTGVVFYYLHAILYWFFNHLSRKIWKKSKAIFFINKIRNYVYIKLASVLKSKSYAIMYIMYVYTTLLNRFLSKLVWRLFSQMVYFSKVHSHMSVSKII